MFKLLEFRCDPYCCYADLILTLPANDTVTEGQPGEVVVMLSSIDYAFDFTVTLMTMDGSAVG